MGDDKGKVSDKASEIARNIWLAGVGAYGRAVGEAQDRLGKAGRESPKLFRDLVKAGAALENEARDTLSVGEDARQSVEERINRVRENFSLQRSVRSDELKELHRKIDQLSAKVEAICAALEAGPGTRVKGATRRSTTTGAAPAARKKGAAKAPASKKTAARSGSSKPR